MANMNRTKVITGINTKLSYFHGWEPVSINGGAEKYSVSVLIPKDDTETVNAVNKAIDAAIEEGCCKIRQVRSLIRLQSSFHFAMVISSVTMRLTKDITSSMRTAQQHRRLSIVQ